MPTLPKVSVSIITYNHENYIRDAIDSVLAQKTDFSFEIIIGDDFSDDATVDILKSYQQKYSDIIHLILHPKRYEGVPGRLNNITNLYACRGEYVALLDGDDYWLDENKLQTQVDFLEANPEFNVIASDALKIDTSGEDTGGRYGESHFHLQKDNTFTHDDVLRAGWCIAQTSSIMYRNRQFEEFPDWFWHIISADFGLLLLVSQKGKIKYLKKAFTAYRIHDHSFMSKHYFSMEMLAQKIAELQKIRKTFLPYRSKGSFSKNLRKSYQINRKIAWTKFAYAKKLRRKEGIVKALEYLAKSAFSNFSGFFYMRIFLGRIGLWPC